MHGWRGRKLRRSVNRRERLPDRRRRGGQGRQSLRFSTRRGFLMADREAARLGRDLGPRRRGAGGFTPLGGLWGGAAALEGGAGSGLPPGADAGGTVGGAGALGDAAGFPPGATTGWFAGGAAALEGGAGSGFPPAAGAG